MKLYLTQNIFKRNPNLKSMLERLEIPHTADENDAGITLAFVQTNVDRTIPINGLDEFMNLIEVHKFNSGEFLMEKCGISGTHAVADKWRLYQILTALNMPAIPTIFPTTEQQITDFIAEHGTVFSKPCLGYSVSEPTMNINSLFGLKNVDKTELDEYLATIPMLSTLDHLYKSITSIGDLTTTISIEELLNIQNNPKAIRPYQMILQKDFQANNTEYNHFLVQGFVNGNHEVVYDPYVIGQKTYQAIPKSFFESIEDKPQLAKTEPKTKFAFDYDSLTYQQIVDMLNNRNVMGDDPYDMETKLQQIFEYANVKNTTFTVQGYINENDEVIFFDFGIGYGEQMFRRAEIIGDEAFLNKFKFMTDQAYTGTKYDLAHLGYRFWANALIPNGLSTNLVNLAKSSNLIFPYPVTLGQQRVSTIAYGDTPEIVATNIKAFLTASKNI